MADVIFYVFYGIGASVAWLFKGCRASFWDEFGENETRNGIGWGFLIMLGFLGLAIYINN